jgi:hypothetical protein
MSVFIHKKDYVYLSNKLSNFYFFYKWFDHLFLFDKGSLFIFHKDPTVPFISYNDQKKTYMFYSGFDTSFFDFYYCLLLIMLPFLLFLKLIIYSILIYDLESGTIITFYDQDCFYWIAWFLTSFEILHSNIGKLIFSGLCNIYSYHDFDYIEYFLNSDSNIFSLQQSNELFPLYKYFSVKYLSFEELNLIENTLPHMNFDLSKWHHFYLYPLENLFIFFDIFYMKFIKLDHYSTFIIYFNLIRFLFLLFLFLFLFYNNSKFTKFFIYIKVNFSNFTFSHIKLNNFSSEIKKWI